MKRALVLVAIAVAATVPLVLPVHILTIVNFIGLASLVVIGLVLLTGIGGLTSFGQAAFVGMGAYVTAWVTTAWGLSPWLSVVASIGVPLLFALLIGMLTLRLSGHFLPLSTMAWSLSLFFLVGNISALGGHDGMSGVPPLRFFQTPLSGASYTFLIWICVLLVYVATRNLLDSRQGRAIRALRGRALMLEGFGVDTARLKMFIFAYSAALAGLSGWLYAHLLQFVSPTPFGLNVSVEYLFMAVIGGSASLWGAILGSTIFIVLRDGLQNLIPSLVGSGGAVEGLVFGVIIVVVLQRMRGGITGGIQKILPLKPKRKTAPWSAAAALPSRSKPKTGEPVLQVENLTKRFGGLVAVNDVSFTLEAGKILGVIGPNGAGKSTLFNLLTCVVPADTGMLTVRGLSATGMSPRKISGIGVARTFQHAMLRNTMTVLENAAIGASWRGRKRIWHALLRLDRDEEAALLAEARRQLDRVGLAEFADAPAGSLSLGQQRILEIARALAADPSILLLDEPAAGLRYQEKLKLAELLDQLRLEGMTILIVEHDMEFVMGLVDQLVVMNFGRSIAEGQPSAVQADKAVQDAYLGGDLD
jgi:branched-chain amino acid transport system permease protein